MRSVSRAPSESGTVQVNTVELLTFGGAIVADRMIGEWPNALHPVVWMGKVASWLEKGLPARGPAVELAWGAMIVVVVPGSFAAASAIVLAQTKPYPVLECLIGIV
ncbi:MAG: cobalamin biosynthesis protein, partial [Polyangiaceae bacterium]